MRIDKLNPAVAPKTAGSTPVQSGPLRSQALLHPSELAIPKTVTLNDGRSFALPVLSDEEQQRGSVALEGLDEDQQAAFAAAGLRIGQAFNQAGLQAVAAATPADGNGAALKEVSSAAKAQVGPVANIASPQLTQSINDATNLYQNAKPQVDYEKTVQAVTYMGVRGMLTDLTNYAKSVQSKLEQKKKLQVQIQMIAEDLDEWPDDGSKRDIEVTTFDSDGKAAVSTRSMTKEQAKTARDSLTNVVSGFSDQDQIDQLNLQQMSQNYSQGLTTISNIMKINFETVKGIIGNIRS